MKKSLVLFLAVSAVILTAFGVFNRGVELPNGYSLVIRHNRQPELVDPSGASLFPASQFMVSGSYVYGWMDNVDKRFFILNTENGELLKYLTWKKLDVITSDRGIPSFDMGRSVTYWDIKSGHNKKTW